MQYGTFRIAKRYVPERETYRFGFPNGLFCKPFLPQKRRFRTVFRQKTGAFHCTSGLARRTTDTRPTGYALHTRGCDICGQSRAPFRTRDSRQCKQRVFLTFSPPPCPADASTEVPPRHRQVRRGDSRHLCAASTGNGGKQQPWAAAHDLRGGSGQRKPPTDSAKRIVTNRRVFVANSLLAAA